MPRRAAAQRRSWLREATGPTPGVAPALRSGQHQQAFGAGGSSGKEGEDGGPLGLVASITCRQPSSPPTFPGTAELSSPHLGCKGQAFLHHSTLL